MTDVHTSNRAWRYTQHKAQRFADVLVVPLLPSRAANLLQSRLANWEPYFKDAEGEFEGQWKDIIWPLIKDFDFDTVLELSPGGGRNTERLSMLTSRLIVVDYRQNALNLTRARLGTNRGDCEISYHRNNGSDLKMVADESVTAFYCWDSAVHFDKSVLLSYIGEFARILKPGGSGFLHHSTLGERADKDIKQNPGWRSNVSTEMVARACEENGLTVVLQQPVQWIETVDCTTIFRKDV